MGKLIFLIFLASPNVFASGFCASFFQEIPTHDKSVKFDVETSHGKPRYYSVKNYHRHLGSELDLFLRTFRNLTQFSEKLDQVDTFIPSRESVIPSEVFFVANQIIPLIESYLRVHGVSYRIDRIQNPLDNRIKRSLFVISKDGQNILNDLAKVLGEKGTVLTIDPMELFRGYTHYNQGHGKRFELDNYHPAYAMSFHLLMHSQRKDFKKSELPRDEGINEILYDK